MIENLPELVLSALGVIVAIVTIMWRIQSRLSDKLTAAIEQRLVQIEKDVKAVEENRRKGDHAVHERINHIESTWTRDIVERLSHIEGQLKPLQNISQLMERWLIENGGRLNE